MPLPERSTCWHFKLKQFLPFTGHGLLWTQSYYIVYLTCIIYVHHLSFDPSIYLYSYSHNHASLFIILVCNLLLVCRHHYSNRVFICHYSFVYLEILEYCLPHRIWLLNICTRTATLTINFSLITRLLKTYIILLNMNMLYSSIICGCICTKYKTGVEVWCSRDGCLRWYWNLI